MCRVEQNWNSLARALQILGYNVHDVYEHFTLHRQEWLDSFETSHLPNFKEVFQGVDAVSDVPPAYWFEQIAEAFPEAKVILTVRDSEDVWLKSWQEHLRVIQLPFYKKIFDLAPYHRKTHRFFLFTLHKAIDPEAAALYRSKYGRHNARVQTVIPAGKLLVYNVKQGLEPLCEFLGCDVPTVQFPHLNGGHWRTKNQMSEQRQHAKRELLIILILLVFAVCLLVALFSLFDVIR